MNYQNIYYRAETFYPLAQQEHANFDFSPLRRFIASSLQPMYIYFWGNQISNTIDHLGSEAVDHQNDMTDDPDLQHFVPIPSIQDQEEAPGRAEVPENLKEVNINYEGRVVTLRAVVPEPVFVPAPTAQRRNRYASKLAIMCRLEIPGVEIHSASNTLVAKHFISRQMEKDNVRIIYRMGIMNRALLFIRTPTHDDIIVRQMAQATAVLEMQRDGRKQYHSRGPSTLWNWFGKKYFEPEPPGC